MSQATPLSVVFAENDTLFRLMEMALLRQATPQGEAALTYFFGPRIDQPLRALVEMGDRLGLPRDVETTVCASEQAFDLAAGRADVLVLERTRLDKDRISRLAGRVRLIQQFGQDTRHIDLEAARAHTIPLATLLRLTSLSCADHIVALILATGRNLLAAHRAVVGRRQATAAAAFPSDPPRTAFNWADIGGIRVMAEQTIGFVGMGENAALVARRLQGFGPRMIYFKRTRLTAEEERDQGGVCYAPLDTLLAQSDFVCLNVPYGPATEKMADAAFLARMKPGAVLINTSRGGIVDEAALYAALSSGRLAGAALDVYRYEPVPPDCPLLDLDSVLWSPHMAAGRPEFMLRDSEDVLANIARVLRGEAPLQQIAP